MFTQVLAAAMGTSDTDPSARPPRGPLGHLKMAGTTGRLGEAFLNAALARGDVQKVEVLVQQPFTRAPARLFGVGEAQWLASPPADALVLLPQLGHDGLARFSNARDAVYASLDFPMMQRLLGQIEPGRTRVMLIHPVSAWQQVGAFQRGLAGPLEEAVAGCGAYSVTIVRPVLSATSPAGSWVQRVASIYMSVQLLMMPRSLPSLTSAQIGTLALQRLAQAGPGVSLIGANELLPPAV